MAEIAQVQDPIINYAKSQGWLVRRVQWIGRHGAPDALFMREGRVIFMEFKDLGKPAKLHQERERKRIIDHGIEAYVVDSEEQGIAILNS